jgi:3'-5' exoribonuclease
VPVRELADRARVKGTYRAARKQTGTDKNGKPILSLLLCDKTGQIEARVFENADRLAAGFEEGDYVRVTGTAKSFQGRLQVHVQGIERVAESAVAPADYQPVSSRDPEDMWRELQAAIGTVRDPDVLRLLRALFDDPEIAARFRRAPAAKTIHHAWVGGLLEHNLSVYRIIDGLCAHYAAEAPGLLDRDLCVAGGLLHDFGKIYELSAERSFEYTHEGRLIGHLVLCSEKIAEVAWRLGDFPREKVLQLQHIVLAHHDRLEYGSPKRPHTAEAMLVHAADVLDSRMGFLRELFAREAAPGWTGYQKIFDRPFWHGGGSGAEAAAPTAGSPEDPFEIE